MPECACGCGEETKRAKFLAGHEQKLRKELDEKVGGLPLLASPGEGDPNVRPGPDEPGGPGPPGQADLPKGLTGRGQEVRTLVAAFSPAAGPSLGLPCPAGLS